MNGTFSEEFAECLPPMKNGFLTLNWPIARKDGIIGYCKREIASAGSYLLSYEIIAENEHMFSVELEFAWSTGVLHGMYRFGHETGKIYAEDNQLT